MPTRSHTSKLDPEDLPEPNTPGGSTGGTSARPAAEAGAAPGNSDPTGEQPYSGRMRRLMLRFLQKRKFRLVTRWKATLKENIGVPMPGQAHFPYTLIFRAFDDVIRLLKQETIDPAQDVTESLLTALAGPVLPTSDHYMELFLSGRDVLGSFVETDASFAAIFSEGDRQNLRGALEQVFKHLIDREMREYSKRYSGTYPG